MTTERIRLTISVTPEVHAVFTQMAEASGVSLGRAMGDWLGDTIEGAQFVAHKVAQAKQAPKLVMREMHAFARGVASEVDQALEASRRREGGGAAARGRVAVAPSSNTGLNPPKGANSRGRK